MKNIALFALLLTVRLSAAGAIDAAVLQTIMGAKSSGHIRAMTAAYAILKESRLSCEFQLQDRIIPTACYRALKLELQLGLIKKEKGLAMVRHLDQTCLEFADSDEGALPSSDLALSPVCRGVHGKLQAVTAYRNKKRVWSGN